MRPALCVAVGGASTLFAKGVLVTAALPDSLSLPRLGGEEGLEGGRGKDPHPARFTAPAKSGQPGHAPHEQQWDGSPNDKTGFTDKATPAGGEHTMDLGDGLAWARQHGEKPGGDNVLERAVRIRQGEGVNAFEAALAQAETGRLVARALELLGRLVDPGDPQAGMTPSQPAGIKAGAAPELEQTGAGRGRPVRPEIARDPCGVVAKKMLAKENVEPGKPFKETLPPGGMVRSPQAR